MCKKLNIAIIGQGRSGMDIHGKYFLSDGGREKYNVVAVVEWDDARRARAKEVFGCDVYSDYRELFSRNDIDVVTNATFSYCHTAVAQELLEHGFNVISEKPFSKYVLECEKAIAAAKRSGAMFSIFQQSRYAPYYVKIKEILASGVLGRVHQISIKFSGFARRWDWQCSNRFYGGALLNTGPHPMDQALDLLNTDDMPQVFSVLKKINSAGDAEDYAKVILTYPDRPLIDIEISGADAYNDYIYNIQAEKGSLRAGMLQVKYKYHDDKPMPALDLEPLRGDDGVQPSYCKEELKWNEEVYDIKEDVFTAGTARYYENIYDHLVNGAALGIRPEKILQQIRVMELIHAQNPMPTLY